MLRVLLTYSSKRTRCGASLNGWNIYFSSLLIVNLGKNSTNHLHWTYCVSRTIQFTYYFGVRSRFWDARGAASLWLDTLQLSHVHLTFNFSTISMRLTGSQWVKLELCSQTVPRFGFSNPLCTDSTKFSYYLYKWIEHLYSLEWCVFISACPAALKSYKYLKLSTKYSTLIIWSTLNRCSGHTDNSATSLLACSYWQWIAN